MERASEARNLIREIGDHAGEEELRVLLNEVEDEISIITDAAALVLVAFFEGSKPKEREALRLRFGDMRLDDSSCDRLARVVSNLPMKPFHWELEFPEVFERENPGFDVIVGNPPFLGGKRISTTLGASYRDWLGMLHKQSNSNADLVAHFFRRAFCLLRVGGTFGLIATNTIGQGDTRATGLRRICKNGGEIYRVQKRLKWPGDAAVVVSVVHISKGEYRGPRRIDGVEVGAISAYLAPGTRHDDPERLVVNDSKSYVGMYLRGMGFTFDDTDNNIKD